VIEKLTLMVFATVGAGTVILWMVAGGARLRAVRRLVDRPEAPEKVVPSIYSYATIWRDLVNRIGNVLPAAPKDLPRLKRRLISAGYRHPSAARYFRGIRAVTTMVFGALAFLVAGPALGAWDNLLLIAGGGLLLGFMAASQYLSMAIRRRRHAIAKGLPNALDLMVVCVESGLGTDQTTLQVAKELQAAHPEISDEFTVMNLELRAGKKRADALHNLADRTGVEEVKKLVAVLVQTDRFGTSIAQSLRGHADYLRIMARQRAEEKASKLAVKLVFPIFFCVLPSLFVVTIGPVLTRLIRDLLPMIDNM
jgi:tight adherence protein C